MACACSRRYTAHSAPRGQEAPTGGVSTCSTDEESVDSDDEWDLVSSVSEANFRHFASFRDAGDTGWPAHSVGVQVLFVEFCWFFICIFVVFGSIHIQNLQESQGWRELRLYARSFSLYFVMVLGLYILVFGPRSVNPSVRPRQYTRLPSVPRLHGFSFFMAQCSLKQACAAQT